MALYHQQGLADGNGFSFFGFMYIDEGEFFFYQLFGELARSILPYLSPLGLKSESLTARSRGKFGATASNGQVPCLTLRGLGFWLRMGIRM